MNILLILMLSVVAELEPFPRQLHDNSGNTVTIATQPQRIVSLTLATDEILLAICPPKRIAAISTMATDSNYSNITIQAKKIPNKTTTNIEYILNFKPDLVFIASYSQAEMVELLQKTDTSIFRFSNFNNIADIKKNIKTIGFAIGEDRNAATIVAQMEADIEAIQNSIPNKKSPRIMSYSLGNYTAGRNTTFDDMAKLVGAINIVAEQGIEQHVKINSEYILAWQPEFIISHARKDKFHLVKQQMLTNPAIAASKAKIILIENRHFLSVSQYIVAGIKTLAKELYK
ncbi:ABC transporter substrate-binding protein [Candidatus Halobeggiatoa sp. HSG11]|nr:ABC transporter substrate-binding protein [Candidatus Halobeggiatoa sp. HSG11]